MDADRRELSGRKRPAHPAPLRLANRPTLVFLTVCVGERRRLLAAEEAHALLTAGWRRANRWQVGRYVVMPDHVHLFCAPCDEETPLKRWVEYWRWWVTRGWPRDSEKPIWQRDFWDRQMRMGESYAEKWAYVRENPVRAGLVQCAEEWPYQGEMNVLRW